MAKYGQSGTWLLLDGFDLSGDSSEIAEEKSAKLEQSDGFGKSWREFLGTGALMNELSQRGWYDDATDKIAAALDGQQMVERTVCYGIEDMVIGRKFVGLQGTFASKYRRVPVRDELLKVSNDMSVSGKKSEGIILQHLTPKTADWNTEGAESVDNAASSANGGEGFMQVRSMTGFTGFIGKIRHSSDDVTYVDLITFANHTLVRGAQRLTVAGTVNRHLCFDGNVTGSGTIEVFAGFARTP